MLRSISETSSCFLGPRPWHIEIRHRAQKNIHNWFVQIWDSQVENSKIEIKETDRRSHRGQYAAFPDDLVIWIGAKHCTPEINTSEIIVDFQWHFPMDLSNLFSLVSGIFQTIVTSPVDLYWSFPTDFSGIFSDSHHGLFSGIFEFHLCDFWCICLPLW